MGLGLASCLLKSGHRVDLVARSDTVDALHRDGLHRTGLFGDYHAEPHLFAAASFLLEYVERDYDFILIDCPPSLDILTVNALVAADSILIPIQCEYFALEGISELVETIRQIRRQRNPDLEIEGVLATMFDERTNLAQQVHADLKSFFGSQLFSTRIPRNIRLGEAPSYGRPILLYDIKSKGAESYIRLAKEVINARAEKGFRPGVERAARHTRS